MGEPGDADERRLLAALRDRDEDAFLEVVSSWRAGMLRVALGHVSTRASAEEVLQDTWLAVLEGIDRFEGRAALRTWVFRILINQAKTRGVRERRTLPFSALARAEAEAEEPTVAVERFLRADHPQWPRHWNTFNGSGPRGWGAAPEVRLDERELLGVIGATIDRLPAAQRAVIALRDLEGFEPDEVCGLLGISDGNQRVLLHRARSRVRAAVEQLDQ